MLSLIWNSTFCLGFPIIVQPQAGWPWTITLLTVILRVSISTSSTAVLFCMRSLLDDQHGRWWIESYRAMESCFLHLDDQLMALLLLYDWIMTDKVDLGCSLVELPRTEIFPTLLPPATSLYLVPGTRCSEPWGVLAPATCTRYDKYKLSHVLGAHPTY